MRRAPGPKCAGLPCVMQNSISESTPRVAAGIAADADQAAEQREDEQRGDSDPRRLPGEAAEQRGQRARDAERRHRAGARAVRAARIGDHGQPAAESAPEQLRPSRKPSQQQRHRHGGGGAQPRGPLRAHGVERHRAAQVSGNLAAESGQPFRSTISHTPGSVSREKNLVPGLLCVALDVRHRGPVIEEELELRARPQPRERVLRPRPGEGQSRPRRSSVSINARWRAALRTARRTAAPWPRPARSSRSRSSSPSRAGRR